MIDRLNSQQRRTLFESIRRGVSLRCAPREYLRAALS
jgi:hypothetical protein